MKIFILTTLTLIHLSSLAQVKKAYSLDLDVRYFRGVHVVDDSTVYLAGSHGKILKVVWNDEHTEVDTLLDQGSHEFRDIHVFEDGSIIVLSVSKPAYVTRYDATYRKWSTTLADTAAFWDGFDFQGDTGVLYGDPIDGKLELYWTYDGGRSWSRHLQDVPLEDGVAGYAASGSGVILEEGEAFLALGGFSNWIYQIGNGTIAKHPLPLRTGMAGGPYSIGRSPKGKIIAVGGSYLYPDSTEGNCALLAGLRAASPKRSPEGYLSSVVWVKGKTWVTTGKKGTFLSKNDGVTWKKISDWQGVSLGTYGSTVVMTERSGKLTFMHLK